MTEEINKKGEPVLKAGKAMADDELEGVSGGGDNRSGNTDNYQYYPCPKSDDGKHEFFVSRQGTICMKCMQWEGLVRKK